MPCLYLIQVIEADLDQDHGPCVGGIKTTLAPWETALPLFFFHLRTPAGVAEDDMGIEFPTLERAYLEAYRSIPDMVVELLRQGSDPLVPSFIIADEVGTTLIELPFIEAVRDRPRRPRSRDQRSRRLSGEINALIAKARDTVRQSREILARARDHTL